MRRLLSIALLLALVNTAQSQDEMVQQVRNNIDSIMAQLKAEKDEEKKVKLVLSLYDASIDGYPVLFFEVYQKLYLLSQQQEDIILESSAWSAAGQAYRLTGNHVKALECHQKAVRLAEETGNQPLLRYAQNQMAHIYKDRQEHEKALALYRAAGSFGSESKNLPITWWPPMNMGAVFLNMGELDSSLYYSSMAMELYPAVSRESTLIYLTTNLGSVYSRKNELARAKEYFEKAINLADKYKSPRFYNSTFVEVAEHFYRNNMIDSSVYYAKAAVDVVQNTPLNNLAMKPARLLAEIYQNRNADSSIKYWKVYNVANDSLNNARANQQLMMMTFEEEQRQRDIAIEKNNYRNKIMTTLMLAGIAVVLIIALILYRNNRQKRNANLVLQNTLSDLRATQSQLIQSEKMASLGELTAGIAHEIQNPLNFVNNFSEVNKELIDELQEELKAGNTNGAITISNEIKSNEEKITHHGKRADSIVKGMLQHSRSSNGQKEPTDINVLCDEYLRLAYHGLRAKDKTFNATIKTDFDESIGKVNIIPQDIGRVVLNLLTNAFYAAPLPPKGGFPESDYIHVPTVWLSTKKERDRILIVVKDNGPGIPENIISKIFQPFFTTKPTGQGTGLGLSMSYDIVTKAHGGELKVESKEGEGTTFSIVLPIN